MSKGLWFEVKILPRKEVLDVEGRAIAETLKTNGKPVKECRFGKCIHLLIQEESEEEARKKAKDMAESVLHNPLIETYEIKVLQ